MVYRGQTGRKVGRDVFERSKAGAVTQADCHADRTINVFLRKNKKDE